MHYPKVWLPKHEVPGFRGQLQPQGGREHIPIKNNILTGREGLHTYKKQYNSREGGSTHLYKTILNQGGREHTPIQNNIITRREGVHTNTKQYYSREGREYTPIQSNIIAGREGVHTNTKQYYSREGGSTHLYKTIL